MRGCWVKNVLFLCCVDGEKSQEATIERFLIRDVMRVFDRATY